MIVFNDLHWSNIFSYGKDNHIDLSKDRLSQITGDNGHGKSAVSLILQEILYGKNIKGIKKENLFNRYLPKADILIELFFTSDEDVYQVSLIRKNTAKLKLIKNGNDISSHTATGTYKQIQEIIGYDFKTFVQVTSQSSTSGLEFLTATDTNRKNFLINFLSLEEYTEIHNNFKVLLRESTIAVNELKGAISTIETWITTHKEIDFAAIKIRSGIASPDDIIRELSTLELDYTNAEKINKDIAKNEQYKQLLGKIPAKELTVSLKEPESTKEYYKKRTILEVDVSTAFKVKKQYENLEDICHTCNQPIDHNTVQAIIDEANDTIQSANKHITNLTSMIVDIEDYTKIYNKHIKLVEDFEELVTLIDNSMSSEYVDKQQTEKQIRELKIQIKDIKDLQDEIQRDNLIAEAHNAKIQVIGEQLEEYGELLGAKESEYIEVSDKASKREIIKDAFSTKGIVAFKIESMIKDLERLINEYLTELSDGRFLINFTLSGEKLNIEIITDSTCIAIESLSAGELSRVNVSTLLALRKMMSAISTNRLNVLFLDEITAVLDDDGKERLIEMLMKEENLNTFLIAHDYTHPLIPIIQVVKENNISEVING